MIAEFPVYKPVNEDHETKIDDEVRAKSVGVGIADGTVLTKAPLVFGSLTKPLPTELVARILTSMRSSRLRVNGADVRVVIGTIQ